MLHALKQATHALHRAALLIAIRGGAGTLPAFPCAIPSDAAESV